jgi:serine/threonine protein phosphatase PrpC
MSWNPFKKKEDGTEVPAVPAEEPRVITPPEPAPAANGDGDDTQPIMAAGDVTEKAFLIRESNGVRLEKVEVWGSEGLSDTFLRLLVADPAHPAAGLAKALMELPEELTGFRDLLVRDGYALAAAFDLPEKNLNDLFHGYISGTEDQPFLRAQHLLDITVQLASFLDTLESSYDLAWPEPSLNGIGLQSTGQDLPAGLRGWQPCFLAWDGLSPGRGNPARMLMIIIDGIGFLAQRCQTRGFDLGFMVHRWLHKSLERIAAKPDLTYGELADAVAAIRPHFHIAGLTDNGQRRQHNEDAFLNFEIDQASSTGAQFSLMVVADGMGGHSSGEVASSLALDLLRQQLMMGLLTPRSQPVPTEKLTGQLEVVIPAIDRALSQRAEMDPALDGMGTTLAGVAVLRQSTTMSEQGNRVLRDETAAVFHVGDSRVYSLGPAGLQRLTRDHSFVQDLVDSGSITVDEAFTHPRKNVIMRCLGGGQSDSTPDINCFTPGPGEVLLVCSDGLSDALRDAEIESILVKHLNGPPMEAAQALVDAANAAGGPDNITVLLAQCLIPMESESEAVIH